MAEMLQVLKTKILHRAILHAFSNIKKTALGQYRGKSLIKRIILLAK